MSDSHNEKEMLKQIIAKHRNDTQLFVFLGDGIGNFEDITMFDSKINKIMVKGNDDGDAYVDIYETFVFGGKKFYANHGEVKNVKNGLDELKQEAIKFEADVCLFGHTHIQHYETDGNLILINPGAVTDGGKYCVIDIINGEFSTVFN